MNLVCPSCGSGDIHEMTTIKGVPTNTYTCSSCGYRGPLVVDVDQEDALQERRDFPYAIALVIAIVSVAGFGMGAGLVASASFFIILTAALVLSYHFLGGGKEEAVEEDLKNLDEEGEEKAKASSAP